MDNVMLQFKHSNSKFYEGYLSARVIVDQGLGGGINLRVTRGRVAFFVLNTNRLICFNNT